MTRHRIAQIGENRNPKSPENRLQTRRFLQIRLLQLRRSATPFNGLAVLHGRLDMPPSCPARLTKILVNQRSRRSALRYESGMTTKPVLDLPKISEKGQNPSPHQMPVASKSGPRVPRDLFGTRRKHGRAWHVRHLPVRAFPFRRARPVPASRGRSLRPPENRLAR